MSQQDVNLARAARTAMDREDPDAALSLWGELKARDPANPAVFLGIAKALIALRRNDEVDRLVEDVARDQPDLLDPILGYAVRHMRGNVPLALRYGRAAEQRQDWPEAAIRWNKLRSYLPRQVPVHLGYIRAVARMGHQDNARRAVQRAAAALKSPHRINEFKAALAEDSLLAPLVAAVDAPVADVAPEGEAAARAKALLMHFESFGRNCEFGLLQRHFKAEPLGLLRFATTRPETLVQLLQTRFSSIGDPAQNEIVLVKQEYRLRDTLTGLRMHTRMGPEDADAETVKAKQTRHSAFLRSKLVKDLTKPTKVFVYQKSDLADAELDAIHAAMAAFGPNMLLGVRLSRPGFPPGSVEVRNERLMVGYIDHEANEFLGAGWDISLACWLDLCEQAYAHWLSLDHSGP